MRNLPLFPDLRRRTRRPELMDLPDSDPRKLERTLKQFGLVNIYLSRARHLLKRYVVGRMREERERTYHLIDLGAGACETAAWLIEYCRARGLRLRISACDHDPRVVAFAERRYGNVEGLDIMETDALELDRLAPFDFVFANHLLHHLAPNELAGLFARLESFPDVGVLFSDLRRSRLAYSAYHILSPLILPRSFAVHDGSLSIWKGFRVEEIRGILSQAAGSGAHRYTITRKFPNRIVIWRPLTSPPAF